MIYRVFKLPENKAKCDYDEEKLLTVNTNHSWTYCECDHPTYSLDHKKCSIICIYRPILFFPIYISMYM